eukprot:6677273-Pyramimonas_sp.AAC.1
MSGTEVAVRSETMWVGDTGPVVSGTCSLTRVGAPTPGSTRGRWRRTICGGTAILRRRRERCRQRSRETDRELTSQMSAERGRALERRKRERPP